ncbi:MAG: helix-turn-helix domain-containing protein [Roseovarius sp.]
MASTGMAGTRIRQRRLVAGLKQAELAQAAGISASYLNLIEHNRRRIGGRTLLQIAEALNVEPSALTEGVEAQLLAALQEAAGDGKSGGDIAQAAPELDRIEEFVGRFPGWAGRLAELGRQRDGLERTVKALSERLAHDPELSATLHDVISTVTSIRSTASILAETRELEPEWQTRFHRNLNEDGARLAEGAEALMRYLEAAPEAGAEVTSPQDEMHAFLERHAFHFPQLEGWGATSRVEALIAEIEDRPARALARVALRQYLEDAKTLPRETMSAALEAHGAAPEAIARATGRPMAQVFRRLASLPEDVSGPVGLIVVDGAGALILRKAVMGFATPRSGAGCAMWPLYEVLGQPTRPVQATLVQGDLRVRALAVAEETVPAGFDTPSLMRAYMLILPDRTAAETSQPRPVGVTCRICPIEGCPARREVSILKDGY